MYIWLTGVAAILLLQISECQTCKTDSYIMPTTDGIREMEDATTGVHFSFVARSFQKFELRWSAPSCDSWSQEDNITFIFEQTPTRTKIDRLIEESFTNCSSLKKFKWESMETVQLKISFRNATSRKYCYKLYSDSTLNIVLPAPKIEKNNISDPTKMSFIGLGFRSFNAQCRLKYKEGQSLDNDWLEGTCPAVKPQTSPHKCYITNVKRGTSYSVKIACQLRNMPLSNWSDPKVYFTPMAAPTGKVSAVNIKDTGDSGYRRSMNVSWQTIPEDQQNGEILFFSISVHDTTCGAPQKTYNTSMLSYIIHDLYYSCDYRVYITASNPVGESPPRVMNLDRLNRKPSPAREFAVISISSESIQLSWREPEQPYGEINYTLSVQRKDSGTLEQSVEIVPTASRETGEVERYNVTGLAPYTTYQLKLVAKNYYSENDGIILEKTTNESVPTKGPVDLTLGHMAAQVTVRWGAVPQEQRNGIIVNYTLFWWQRGINSATCQSEPPLSASNITVTGDSHTIEGLEEKTSYCVTVTASTSVGQGPPAEVKNITTQRGAVTVRHITVINTTSDSISLEWNLPKDVNSTQLQLIQIYHNDAKAPLKLYNGLTSHTLTNLEPYTNYSISVQACWSKFQLDSCGDNETVHVRTISTVPSEPTDLITSYLAYDHVNLTWHPPKKPNGPISHYMVTYCNDGSKMQQEEKTKSLSMTLNIPCSTIGTGRTFMFQVAAVVDGLIGPAAKHNTTMCENVHRVSDFIIALIGIPGLLVSALLSMACCWAVAPKRNLEIKHAKAIYQPNMVNSCAKVPEKEMFDTLKCQTDMKLESNSETYVAMEPNRFAALRTSTSNQSYMQMSRDTGYVSDLT